MLIKDVLDLSRKIFLAAAIDDFLLASRYANVARSIGKIPEVAGTKPAVRRKAVAIRFVVVQIAEVNLWPARSKFPGFSIRNRLTCFIEDGQFQFVDAASYRAIDFERVVIQAREGMEARFQDAVQLDQASVRKRDLECLDGLDGRRCATSDHDP